MNDTITTYSKIKFSPFEAKAEHIQIQDIAHALSLLCRANGHCKHFHSVAQHCLNCSVEARARGFNPKIQLACLLHDGSEAYLSDITRPVKKYLDVYRETEARLQNLIYQVFLPEPLSKMEQKMIDEIDDSLLYYEFLSLMEEKIFVQPPALSSNPDFTFRPFEEVEQDFLSAFQQLSDLLE